MYHGAKIAQKSDDHHHFASKCEGFASHRPGVTLLRGETYEESTFGDGFVRHDYGVGLVGAGYSSLHQDALHVTMAALARCCVNGI
jgi:hypothetical protein